MSVLSSILHAVNKLGYLFARLVKTRFYGFDVVILNGDSSRASLNVSNHWKASPSPQREREEEKEKAPTGLYAAGVDLGLIDPSKVYQHENVPIVWP